MKVNISFPWAFLLGSVLVILKSLGSIDMEWIWVLAPFWIPLAIVFFPVLFVLAAVVVLTLVSIVIYPIAWVDNWNRERKYKRSHTSQKISRYNR